MKTKTAKPRVGLDWSVFWSRVLKDNGENACWYLRPGNENIMYRLNRPYINGFPVTRILWTAIHGRIPAKMFVCHHCDNPLCINPKHLFIGTAKDNTRDMIQKGRRVNPCTYKQRESKKMTLINRSKLHNQTNSGIKNHERISITIEKPVFEELCKRLPRFGDRSLVMRKLLDMFLKNEVQVKTDSRTL